MNPERIPTRTPRNDMNDPISDFLTRIRNGLSAGQEQVLAPFSKMKQELARILKEEGYIWSYELDTTGAHPRLKVKLKYTDDNSPVIRSLKRVSSPGLRQYVSCDEIPACSAASALPSFPPPAAS